MANLFWGVILGSIGLGFVMYGRRQRRAAALAAGVALCVLPYFVTNPWLLASLGLGAMALPMVVPY